MAQEGSTVERGVLFQQLVKGLSLPILLLIAITSLKNQLSMQTSFTNLPSFFPTRRNQALPQLCMTGFQDWWRDESGGRLQSGQSLWIIIKLMLESKFQTKHLQDIVYNKPNFLTGVRFLMNYVAAWLFPQHPQSAGLVLMISVILDYFDGKVARKYNQCTFVGEIFDWITDIFNYIICLFWWYQLEPELLSLMGTLLCLEIVTMMVDIISKCYGYHPKLNTDHWVTYILKFTMNVEQRGYTSIGLGYWNTILHWLCIVARVLSLSTPYYGLWNYVFLACLPGSVSYVWMHLGYTMNILDRWNQEFREEEIRLKFIEK